MAEPLRTDAPMSIRPLLMMCSSHPRNWEQFGNSGSSGPHWRTTRIRPRHGPFWSFFDQIRNRARKVQRRHDVRDVLGDPADSGRLRFHAGAPSSMSVAATGRCWR